MSVQNYLSTILVVALTLGLSLPYILADSLGLSHAAKGEGSLFPVAWEALLAAGAICGVLVFNHSHQKQRKTVDKLGYARKSIAEPELKSAIVIQQSLEQTKLRRPLTKSPNCATRSLYNEPVQPEEPAEKLRLIETLQGLVKKGDVYRASKTLQHIEENFGKASLTEYTNFITMCSKSGDRDASYRCLSRIAEVGLTPNAVCFNSVINVFAKKGDMKKALAIVDQMKSAGVDFDTVTYNTLIDAWARAADATSAQFWMRRMLSSGVKPSVVSFASVMRACAQAGLKDDLEQWVQQSDNLGIELNMICYSAVINGFAKMDDLITASTWLDRMISKCITPNAPSFTVLLHAIVNKGDIEHAATVINRLISAKVPLDAPVFSVAICAAANGGNHVYAQNWADSVVATGFQLSASAESALIASDLRVPRRGANKICEQVDEQAVGVETGLAMSRTAARRSMVGRKFVGTIKEFIPSKFGYIECDEVSAVFKRDIFLCNVDNPLQFAKGQRVTFTLQIDRQRGLPRAANVRVFNPAA